ncbi:MAG: hypothetical protein RL173_1250 [Fibrobacterota bacterium]|jgi:hypothetical protein
MECGAKPLLLRALFPSALVVALLTIPVATRADVMPTGHHGVDLVTIVRSPARPGWKLYGEQQWLGGYRPGMFLKAGNDTVRYFGYQTLVNFFWIREADLVRIPCDLAVEACVKSKDDTAFHSIKLLAGERSIFSRVTAHDSTGLIEMTEILEVRDSLVSHVRIDRTYRIPYRNGIISNETELHPWPNASNVGVGSTMAGGFGINSFRGSRVVVTIPVGFARLKLFGISGAVRKSIKIAPTGNRPGAVDLGIVPRRGEFIVLEQGAHRSVRFILE